MPRGDREAIKNFDSKAKVIVFKSAIATGWDCPRLKSLALLRQNKSKPFTIQTVGRALRQPERKHYANEALNHAYAFTGSDLIPLMLKELLNAKTSE